MSAVIAYIALPQCAGQLHITSRQTTPARHTNVLSISGGVERAQLIFLPSFNIAISNERVSLFAVLCAVLPSYLLGKTEPAMNSQMKSGNPPCFSNKAQLFYLRARCRGAVTIKSLRRLAAHLDTEFVILNHWVPIVEFCFLLSQGYGRIYRSRKFQ